MKIRPLQDRVMIRRAKEEEKTKGGIIIPDTAKEKPVEATVVAVGNGKVLEDGSVRKLDVSEVRNLSVNVGNQTGVTAPISYTPATVPSGPEIRCNSSWMIKSGGGSGAPRGLPAASLHGP